MSARSCRHALLLVPLCLAACAALPGTGPSTNKMVRSPIVDVVEVTPAMAAAANARLLLNEHAKVARALADLNGAAPTAIDLIGPGDTIEVTLWSFAAGLTASTAGPSSSSLGLFVVAPDGSVDLPYTGPMTLAGLDLPRAQSLIARRYAALRTLLKPSATLRIVASPHSDILVTGAVGKPMSVPWSPAGVTLADAVTRAIGDGNVTLGQGDLSQTKSAIRVSVFRGPQVAIELPASIALQERIPLLPGDRIIVTKAPAVRVALLGDGARKDGVLGFDTQPTLSEALAQAGGLDGNAANDHAIFVLRRGDGVRPTLFSFDWTKPAGFVAATNFPLADGDTIYVAEAPIVSVQRVIGILFQATLPAQLLR